MILASKDDNATSAAAVILATISGLVGVTYGPAGSLVAITRDGKTSITKDGVTVLNAIQSDSPFETAIIEVIKEASVNTMSRAGDGTTATIILANAIIKEGCELNNIESFLQSAREYLSSIAIQNPNDKMLMKLALTSTNWDYPLSRAIVSAADYAKTGAIVATPNFGGETKLQVADKIDIFAAVLAPEFISDIAESKTEMHNPKILVSLTRLEGESDILDMVDTVIKNEEEDIVILMPGAEVKSIAALKVNHLGRVLNILPVMVGSISGGDNADALYDISVAVGATPLGTSSGKSLSSLSEDNFGTAKSVIYEKGRLIIEDAGGEEGKRKSLANSYIVASEKEPVERMKEAMRRRSSLVSGKSIEIKIGGANNASILEKKDRADDAIQSVQNAIKYGVLPGGGMAYAYLAHQSISAAFTSALMYPIDILSGTNAVPLSFELYNELVSYNSEEGIIGISSDMAPMDSYSTVMSVLEQSLELAKLISSIKATVVSNTGGINAKR